MKISTKIEGFTLRDAEECDVPIIAGLVRELAEFEKLTDTVSATEADYIQTLFREPRRAEVIIAELHGEPVAFALFFHNYSTFLAKPGLYLEDLFVKPEFRGRGYGGVILSFLAQLALHRGCGRFEWSVLDWNEPAIKFYKSLGAELMTDWTGNRVTGKALEALASRFAADEI